ncbi:MAG: enoyl-CoA hydratase [Dehalococcoidia bacterium]|nr:enoyl-CoA hydratase [Dehalococcoidia bacterium]
MAEHSFEDILYEKRGGIATVTINRPHRMNAGRHQTYQEMNRALDEAEADPGVRVVVLTGAGRGFCSGDDVQDIFLAEASKAEEKKRERTQARLHSLAGKGRSGVDRIMFMDKPTIAAVNGAAVGYGMDIALFCDIRIASDKARFGELFVKRGLMGDAGAMVILQRLVGLGKAYELVLTGDIIDAQEALRSGLVNYVVPHEELLAHTLEMARKLAAAAPLGQMMSKQGIRRAMGLDIERFLEWQGTAQSLLLQTEDHVEGAKSFVEKREPQFKGR